jgi:RHS repeat-associated protein
LLKLNERDHLGARHHRIVWRHPSAGGDDALWTYPVYDHRWRMIAVYKEPEGGGSPVLKERFYYHNAGIAGGGGSSYVDSVIRRDRDAVAAEEGPETLEETLYYLQNWRGDVVATVQSNGRLAEQVRYSAYGRPFCVPMGDFNASGQVSVQDIFDFNAAFYADSPRSDWNFSGAYGVSSGSTQDLFDFLTDWFTSGSGTTGGRDTLTASLSGYRAFDNRKGYAGYEHDVVASQLPNASTLGVQMQLARYRWYRADVERWMSRDPIGYRAGLNLVEYVNGHLPSGIDPYGLLYVFCGSIRPQGCREWTGNSLGGSHCELVNTCPTESDRTRVACYPVWRSFEQERTLDDGTPCSSATTEQIVECLKRHWQTDRGYPDEPYCVPGNDCHTAVRRQVGSCCLRTTWVPGWQEGILDGYAPYLHNKIRGRCLDMRMNFWGVSYCAKWEYTDWHDNDYPYGPGFVGPRPEEPWFPFAPGAPQR